VFAEQMEYVIFRPYWNVPASIARNETVPAIRRDPAYLTRNDMEIVQGQGDDARPLAPTAANIDLLARGQLRVRQRPGPRNSLGLVKFMFPNSSNVYLHDTPADELFSRARRDFSHGCVRVANPIGLAEFVLRGQPGWDRQRITDAMENGVTLRVDLPRPIPVLLFYITALVTPEGTPFFAADIYRQDVGLLAALRQRT
jgi:murein L,D-transpeptidase YcbB/YkuD